MKLYLIIGSLPAFLLFILIAGLMMGGATSSVPLEPPATEEVAYKYQYIGSELGVPWDIILLSDSIAAEQRGDSGIEGVNPLDSSLEFCVIVETEYKWVVTAAPSTTPSVTPGTTKDTSDPDPTPTPEPAGEWVLVGRKNYTGKNEILKYLGYQGKLEYSEVSNLITDVNEKANKKSSQKQKFEASITVNNDFNTVLKDFIKLDDDNIEKVMELYQSQYLMYLYGYDSGFADLNVELPPLVIGNITRNELAEVASTLINFPYLFGGKSPAAGAPVSAMDCSGFIDWVYIQCFGKGVSGSNLPDGVNISGTAMQFYACQEITEDQLKIGDLGFYYDPATMEPGKINHVGIYIGKINGKDAFIHCGGKAFGYADRPNGRVGISINQPGIYNSYNPITGGTFSPTIPGTNFQYFRRPNFQFKEDTKEENE